MRISKKTAFGLLLPIIALLVAVAMLSTHLSASRATAFGAGVPSGVDVASHQHTQGDIDWTQVAGSGQRYAFVKATEGTNYVNPFYESDVTRAAQAGMYVGAYHYAKPAQSAAAQAAAFAIQIAKLPTPSLPPVLDIEVNDGVDVAGMQAWTRTFVSEVKRLTGRDVMIYTYRYFWEAQMGNTTEFNYLPLWMAAYQATAPTVIPGGWSYMTFWQNSSTGNIPGILGNVDTNLFNGTEAQLAGFLAGNTFGLGSLLYGGMDLAGITDGINNLVAFGQANPGVVSTILAVAAGVVGIGLLVSAAQATGMDLGPAQGLANLVQDLISRGGLPIADLQNMLQAGSYTVGDLIILLQNAAKAIGVVQDTANTIGAAN
ncbi:MAG: GH25 family lysozyme [Corynebacterium sp.]|nr:GH25 family lysozyme [Corynebacterium sp.]